MATITTTTHTEPTLTVDVPRTWWARFRSEAICDDASLDSDDPMLVATARLLAIEPVKVTKAVRRLALPVGLVEALRSHADWYAYFWGEEEAGSAYDSSERLALMAAGRGSRALEGRLGALLADYWAGVEAAEVEQVEALEPADLVARVVEMRNAGQGWRAISRALGLGDSGQPARRLYRKGQPA